MNDYLEFRNGMKKLFSNKAAFESAMRQHAESFPLVESAGSKAELEKIPDVAMAMLTEADWFHIQHLNCDKNYQHLILQEAYELLRDTGDKLAEGYKAHSKKSAIRPSAPMTVVDADKPFSKDAVIDRMVMLSDQANDIIKNGDKLDEGIKNTLAGFCDDLNTLIYKWSQFDA